MDKPAVLYCNCDKSFGVCEADFFVQRPIKLETKMTHTTWVSEQAEVNNFHPVSLLPVIDKILMRALYMCTWSIFGYLEENEILSNETSISS